MQRLFKALYFAGILAQIVVRFPFVRQHRQTAKVDQRVTTTERRLLLVMTVGMFFLPATYSLTRWLDFANYRWSPRSQARAGGAGAVLLAAALGLFWRSHHDLAANWSPSLEIGAQHTLITRGVYRSIRHPMYASQLLWCLAQILLLQNWLAGPMGLVTFLPLYRVRVPREERMMLDHFGDAYRAYQAQTGRVVPRWR